LPIYRYKCYDCGHEFISIHTILETVTKCEKCGSKQVYKSYERPPMVTYNSDGFTKGGETDEK